MNSTVPIIATSRQTRFHPTSSTSLDLDLHDVTLTLGSTELLTSATLKLSPGVKYVLVGRNGTGKSTILKALAEKLIPGIPGGMRIRLLGQQMEAVDAREGETVFEWVVRSYKEMEEVKSRVGVLESALEGEAGGVVEVLRRFEWEEKGRELAEATRIASLRSGVRGMKARKEQKAAEKALEEAEKRLKERYTDDIAEDTKKAATMLAELEATLEDMEASTASTRARALLTGLGFKPAIIDSPITTLSSGNLTRVYLASILFQRSDLLLLDEPTNFLDLTTLLWLQDQLQQHASTLVLVTHDRAFADAIADEVLILHDKTIERFAGNLSTFYKMRAEKIAYLTKMSEAQEKQKEHMKASIASAQAAARKSGDQKKLAMVKSRQKKLEDRMGMEVSTKGTRFKLNRDLPGYHKTSRATIDIPSIPPPPKLHLPTPPHLPPTTPLISTTSLTFTYPHSPSPTLRDTTLTIHATSRIGILGINGAGKSTLVKLLLGELTAKANMVTRHPRVRCGYYSPAMVERLAGEERTALELLGRETEQEGRVELSRLGLGGKAVSDVPVRALSGGQKVRVALALLLNPPPHLLILDEITTHLDAETVETLAKALRKWEGAVVIVSHDRWFVRYVVEGETDNDDGEEEEGEDEGVQREGGVYAVVKGRVRRLMGGVEEFEEKVRKGKVK
ncbi:P-loop containing nucleoside triphosphate hydrolase protein [Ascodesmis nigricans]|uniref:P-loop containing nucleoside triphosphate hydrolase protein n=1 Tax=Ascodesmis nigricans TaxID=341454 RepID=A0A4S2MPD5_9PEZI|nr:P-loop containing nucleoside triphosphate hydrolase protein [Ascodesmis nigricans]